VKVFGRERKSDDFSAEIQAHLDLETERLQEQGLSYEEARAEAYRAFGNVTQTQERFYESSHRMWFDYLWRDVRYSVRMLRKSPSFTLVSILTLAIAIGANAVVFAALNALVLRPLDVPQPQRLYDLTHVGQATGSESYPNYIDYRDLNHSFENLAAADFCEVGLDTGKNPSRAWGYEVSRNYFDALGLRPYLGRFFHASDEHGPNSAPYVVLTYAYWKTHFLADRNVVGRAIQLNRSPFTIIGVAPPGFQGTLQVFPADFFVPIINQEQIDGESLLNARASDWLFELFGRLKPGVTAAQAAAEQNAIYSRLEKMYPKDERKTTFRLVHVGVANVLGGAVKAFLGGLTLLAGLILLAACANLGGLFAARAADRSRELAVRLALGSTRRRILRQLFTEAILVSVAGGAVGLWGSVVLLHWISAWRPFPEFPLNVPVSPDSRVYAAALLLSVASGLLFGAVPVRQVFRMNPYGVIKSGLSINTSRKITARDLLLAAQIAVCAVLVTSSLVALRGLARSLHARLGVEPKNALLVETDLQMAGFGKDKAPAMQRRMINAMKTIPGVTSVGLVSNLPLSLDWDRTAVFTDAEANLSPSNAAAIAFQYDVSPGYFRAAGAALLEGRTFTWQDDRKSTRVAVVNEEFARKLFGSPANALGNSFKMGNGISTKVIGIVEDGKYSPDLADRHQSAMFLPILQSPARDAWLVVRSSEDPQMLAAAIQSKLRHADPGLPSFIQTWNEEMSVALFAPRMATASLGILGLMGAMLSITGIFGMAAYSVSKRTRELGIRIALGAHRKEVLQAAFGRAFKLLAFGSVAGLALGILASRVLASIVYLATPRDPFVLLGVVLAMSVVGLLAAWIPAQRALSVDPSIVIREE
jgi:predicted permease